MHTNHISVMVQCYREYAVQAKEYKMKTSSLAELNNFSTKFIVCNAHKSYLGNGPTSSTHAEVSHTYIAIEPCVRFEQAKRREQQHVPIH